MGTIDLKEGERLDDLQRNGFKIIQNPEKFCFGMDAVLLSGFAAAAEGAESEASGAAEEDEEDVAEEAVPVP